MERSTTLDIPLLLPEVKEAQDACITRLVSLLAERDGVLRAHVARADGVHDDATTTCSDDAAQLCLHYDPDRLSLTQLEQIAHAAGAEISNQFGHVLIPVRALGSEDDGLRIEESLRNVAGVTAASCNLAAQVVRVEYDRRLTSEAAIRTVLDDAGARSTTDAAEVPGASGAHAHEDGTHARQQPSWYRRNRELVWSLASGVLVIAGWIAERGSTGQSALAIGLFAGAYAFGGRDNVGHFLGDLRRGHFRFNIDLLMVVAAVGAAVIGEWFEGALLLFLFSLGHALEHYAMGRARNAIKALAELAPSRATVLRETGGRRTEVTVAIEQVLLGDLVVVKPAERIAVDGLVSEGRSGVNQAPITGESAPVDKAPGDTVFAGSVNGEGALVVQVTGAVGDRTLDRVIKLVSEAQTQKAPTQQFTDRFQRIFVPAVLIADVLIMLVPPLLGVWTWPDAFYRAMALLVAASPCALALGTPAAVLSGIAQAARNGVLIKGGAHLEALGMISVIALDKTGTITRGEPVVANIATASGVSEDELLSAAAAVERRSQHPLARAVLHAAESRRLMIPDAGEMQSVTARGVRAPVGRDLVEVGRLLMFEEGGAPVPQVIRDSVTRLEAEGRTTMVVRRRAMDAASTADGGWLGVLGIADEPRANVAETLVRLREAGITRIVMLTGDNAGVGNAVARAVGIDEVRAGLLPDDKVSAIRELASHGSVAMVGDGVNDAPALAHATVGIAMGGAGTAAALETADVALMGDDLGRLPFAIGLSRTARGVIRQNLCVSLGVIAILAVATVTGAAGIGTAVILHEGSTLLVIANGLRLLAYRADTASQTAS